MTKTAKTLLIKGGRVIDPASGRDETADVLLVDGAVRAIEARIDGLPGPADRDAAGSATLEAEGLIVAPGLIDPHVHFRQPGQEYKETIESGSDAAVAGGFTTVVMMPNTSPAIDGPEIVEAVLAIAAREAKCRVFTTCCATTGRKGERLVEIDRCRRAGAVGVTDDGDVIESPAMMRRVLEAAAESGLTVMQHAQDRSLTPGSVMHAGEVSTRFGVAGWPRIAEEIVVDRDCRLTASAPGSRYHVQHISSGGTVEILKRWRDAGAAVSGEASPHHLTLTHEACVSPDGEKLLPAAKMNPPLRETSDVRALRQAVADGVITVLATDHAPHAAHEKAEPFEAAPFGIVGLETALPLYAEALVRSGAIGWPRLIAMMTLEPARLCGLDSRGLGSLAVGGPADVTLIDPDLDWAITDDVFRGRSRNSPFVGHHARGRAVATIVGGHPRHFDASVTERWSGEGLA
ncbi:MAG: dihydroorotase [Planctomycetota bacterium]